MSLTRKMLKAMSIDEEKIDQIIEAHTESLSAIKQERDEYKAQAEKLETVQKELDELKEKGDNSELAEKYAKLEKELSDYKAEVQAEKAFQEKEKAYRNLLKEAGVKEKYIDTVIKAEKGVVDGIKLKDGKIENSDELGKNAKSNWSDFIAVTETQTAGAENPPANNGGSKMTRADIYKKDEHGRYILSAAERQKELAKNPDLLK